MEYIEITGKTVDEAITNATIKLSVIEGLLSIQAGENPRVIEEKLKSFLSPAERSKFGGDDGTAEQAGEA